MSDFWHLPGPSRSIRRVAENLAAGRSVVVLEPRHHASGLLPELQAVAPRHHLWTPQGVAPGPAEPIGALLAAADLADAGLRNVEALARDALFGDRLFVVEITAPEHWPAWQDFLLAYEKACRPHPIGGRTLLVLWLRGFLPADLPAEASDLRVEDLRHSVSDLDLRLLAADRSGVALESWQQDLAVSTLAELAIWDPEVVQAGGPKPLHALLSPISWLAELGRSRGWTGQESMSERERIDAQRTVRGRTRAHSSMLALSAAPACKNTLDQRIWNAQMQTLFPLLAQARQVLLRRYRHLLRLPWETTFGRIERIEDLELNHLADQLDAMHTRALHETVAFTRWLRDMRNHLAHFEPVPASHLYQRQYYALFAQVLAEQED